MNFKANSLFKLLLAMLFFSVSAASAAQKIASNPSFDAAQQQRFENITEQLRCLVCQNESLGDSSAPLAKDLRAQIYTQIQRGESDAQIKQYLVARYGQFILFKPMLNSSTYLLWVMPFILLLLAFVSVVWVVLRSKRVPK